MRKLLFFTTILLLGFTACSKDVPHVLITGITLNETALVLKAGKTETLIATIEPINANNQNIVWVSSNTDVATVDDDGVVTAISAGTAIIIAITTDGLHTATCEVTVEFYISASLDGVVIDGIRWTTRNVDMPGTFAKSPESPGMFYQWNKRTAWPSTGDITDWNWSYDLSILSWTRTNDPCPEGWRIPTEREFQSLNNTSSTWAIHNGIYGRVFGIAPNLIFLPAAGHRHIFGGGLYYVGVFGTYFSTTSRISGLVYILEFSSETTGIYWGLRRTGSSVRCVAEN